MSVICSLNFQIGKKKHEEWMWTALVHRRIKEMFNAYKNALSYFSYCVVQYGHWLVSPRVPQRDESRPGFKPNLWAACCRIILNACNKLVLNNQSVTATISAGKRRSCRYIFFLHKFSSFRARMTFAATRGGASPTENWGPYAQHFKKRVGSAFMSNTSRR